MCDEFELLESLGCRGWEVEGCVPAELYDTVKRAFEMLAGTWQPADLQRAK